MDAPAPPNAHGMTLWGAPADAEFPPLCANCGEPAASHLAVAKSFERSSDSETSNTFVVHSASVPFCDGCIARHRAEAPPRRAWSIALSSFASGHMFQAVCLAVVAVFLAGHAAGDLLHGRLSVFVVFAAGAAFFGVMARFLARLGWRESEYARVPKPTGITTAFDFTDNVPAAFEAPKYVCTMRDARFFAAFAALNREREFRPGSPAAIADRRQARRQFWTVGAVVLVIAILLALRELLQ